MSAICPQAYEARAQIRYLCLISVLLLIYLQEGNSALAWSAKHGHEEIVQRLLARGAYFNLPDKVSINIFGLLSLISCFVYDTNVTFPSQSNGCLLTEPADSNSVAKQHDVRDRMT